MSDHLPTPAPPPAPTPARPSTQALLEQLQRDLLTLRLQSGGPGTVRAAVGYGRSLQRAARHSSGLPIEICLVTKNESATLGLRLNTHALTGCADPAEESARTESTRTESTRTESARAEAAGTEAADLWASEEFELKRCASCGAQLDSWLIISGAEPPVPIEGRENMQKTPTSRDDRRPGVLAYPYTGHSSRHRTNTEHISRFFPVGLSELMMGRWPQVRIHGLEWALQLSEAQIHQQRLNEDEPGALWTPVDLAPGPELDQSSWAEAAEELMNFNPEAAARARHEQARAARELAAATINAQRPKWEGPTREDPAWPDPLDLHSESRPAPSRSDESGTHSSTRRWKRSLGRGKS